MVVENKNKTVKGGVSANVGDAEYLFDIIIDHSISLQNQITDNYIEDNSAIQDHIAHSPIVVTLKGLNSEVIYEPPTSLIDKVKYQIADKLGDKVYNFATTKLTVIPALLPPVDNITQMAKQTLQYIQASYERYNKIYKNLIGKAERRERLKNIYKYVITAYNNNTLATVKTPYQEFKDMAIQSVTLSQGNVNYAGDIEITFKQINWAKTTTTAPDTDTMAKYTAIAKAKEANNGKAQGKTMAATWWDRDDVPFSHWKPKGK